MIDDTSPVRPRALLLQEALFDSRVWKPLLDSCSPVFTPDTVDFPVIPGMLDDGTWADHVEAVLAERGPTKAPDGAVVAHGQSAAAAIFSASTGTISGAVILIDPPLQTLFRDSNALFMDRIGDAVVSEEEGNAFIAIFTSISEDELRELHETGRASQATTDAFVSAILEHQHIDQPVLKALLAEMVTARLGAVFSQGAILRDRDPERFPSMAAALGGRLHFVLTEGSMINRLGLVPSIEASLSTAALHDLAGPTGPQGWWERPSAYVDLILEVLATIEPGA